MKNKIKVLFQKEQLRDVYPHATRWQVIKFRVRTFFRKILQLLTLVTFGSVVIGTYVAVFFAGSYSSPIKVFAEKVTEVDSMPQKVDALKTDIVNQIASLESGNSQTKDALITFDDNSRGTLSKKDKASIGCMQFKVSTVQLYQKQLYGKEMSNYDATVLALNCDQAKTLAKDIIFKVPGGLWNWSVATKEMGIKVEIIRQLEK